MSALVKIFGVAPSSRWSSAAEWIHDSGAASTLNSSRPPPPRVLNQPYARSTGQWAPSDRPPDQDPAQHGRRQRPGAAAVASHRSRERPRPTLAVSSTTACIQSVSALLQRAKLLGLLRGREPFSLGALTGVKHSARGSQTHGPATRPIWAVGRKPMRFARSLRRLRGGAPWPCSTSRRVRLTLHVWSKHSGPYLLADGGGRARCQ